MVRGPLQGRASASWDHFEAVLLLLCKLKKCPATLWIEKTEALLDPPNGRLTSWREG